MAFRCVALTFDDGPDSVWTAKVLDALDDAEVKATFFVIGERVRRPPELVSEALARGHSVQPHCWLHTFHRQMTYGEIEEDIDRTLEALSSADAPTPTFWRPPFGNVKRPDSFEIARKRQLRLTTWTANPRDYMGESTSAVMLEALQPLPAPNLLPAVVRQLRAGRVPPSLRPGPVILLHDAVGVFGAQRTTCENTVELILPLAQLVREHGWDFDLLSVDRHPSVVLN
jgi:peptidoglycan/xylan/chitin deacetylase (PgdA/CDA1 family)